MSSAPCPSDGQLYDAWVYPLGRALDGTFSLTLRLSVPEQAPLAGDWFPPPLRATGTG